ncbi:hypothetical protein RVB5_55220 [Pseudomonas aeruginosa]
MQATGIDRQEALAQLAEDLAVDAIVEIEAECGMSVHGRPGTGKARRRAWLRSCHCIARKRGGLSTAPRTGATVAACREQVAMAASVNP